MTYCSWICDGDAREHDQMFSLSLDNLSVTSIPDQVTGLLVKHLVTLTGDVSTEPDTRQQFSLPFAQSDSRGPRTSHHYQETSISFDSSVQYKDPDVHQEAS